MSLMITMSMEEYKKIAHNAMAHKCANKDDILEVMYKVCDTKCQYSEREKVSGIPCDSCLVQSCIAEVEKLRKQETGHWVIGEQMDNIGAADAYICSSCGEVIYVPHYSTDASKLQFCPYCGDYCGRV